MAQSLLVRTKQGSCLQLSHGQEVGPIDLIPHEVTLFNLHVNHSHRPPW